MEKQVLVDPFQQVSNVDYNRFSQFPTESLDHVVGDIGIPGLAYKGFAVTTPSPTVLKVSPGRFYKNGSRYFADVEQTIDLTNDFLPVVTFMWLAITVSGLTMTVNPEARSFLTDVATRATIARQKPTVTARIASASPYRGNIGPDPLKPVPPADVVVVAYVKVSPNGVVLIETNLDTQATNLSALQYRLNENDEWRKSTGGQIETLRSDLANLGGRISGFAPIANVVAQGYDIARLKEKIGLPQTYAAAGADHFLSPDQSDVANADYLAKVEEGIRFADAQIQDVQLGLENTIDPKVMVAGNFMLPAYDLVQGLASVGTDAELSIANFEHTTVQTVQKTRSRTRYRSGSIFKVCTNSTWWNSGRIDPATNVFQLFTGETFQILSTADEGFGTGHLIARVQQFWVDTYDENYWDAVTVPEGIDGYSIAQTFNNTQERFIGEIGLYFSRKAAQGPVHVLLCECLKDASPNPKKVLAKTTISADDIKVGNGVRTAIPITPTLLNVDRYGIMVVSEGNHYLWLTVGNKFADGTLFGTTDGGYFAGLTDLSRDMAFDLGALRFRSPRTEVVLNSLGLPGGIANIDVTAQTLVPGGAAINFAYLKDGQWILMSGATALTGLPAGLPFKAIMKGTTAVMPGLGLLSNSRVRTTRPRSDFRHISTARVMPANVQTVRVRVRLEWWRGVGHHTFDLKLRTGVGYATTSTKVSMTEAPTQDDPANAIDREYFFSFASPGVGSYKIEMSGTTDNVAACFHVAERVDIGIL